jgi:hypothetical protein
MTNNEGERLMRIETLMTNLTETMVRIEAKVDRIDSDVRKDVADLASLKNKGWGILVGVALAAGSAGAMIRQLLG